MVLEKLTGKMTNNEIRYCHGMLILYIGNVFQMLDPRGAWIRTVEGFGHATCLQRMWKRGWRPTGG